MKQCFQVLFPDFLLTSSLKSSVFTSVGSCTSKLYSKRYLEVKILLVFVRTGLINVV